jgi:hypothetical protein
MGPDDLDHERDITLGIHAAMPDLTRDTNWSIRINFHADEDGCCSSGGARTAIQADSINSVSSRIGWQRLLQP